MSPKPFYDAVADKYNACECAEPTINHDKRSKLVAVELGNPDVPRESARWIVFQGTCSSCKATMTFGTQFGGISLTGIGAIKAAAEKMIGHRINWSKIDTSVSKQDDEANAMAWLRAEVNDCGIEAGDDSLMAREPVEV